jgi:hypothetical protein
LKGIWWIKGHIDRFKGIVMGFEVPEGILRESNNPDGI